jgi:hypothetical protein
VQPGSPIDRSIHVVAALESYNGRIVKPQPRRNEDPASTDLHLAELLDFRPDKGIIRLHEQRVVILGDRTADLTRDRRLSSSAYRHPVTNSIGSSISRPPEIHHSVASGAS